MKRLPRALLLSLPFALAAAIFLLRRELPSPGLMDLGAAVAVIAGVTTVAFAAFWRGPREHRAMAEVVAGLEHEMTLQKLELKSSVDFLTAEREISLILGEDCEFRAILEKVLAIVANLLGNRPDDEIEVFIKDRETGKVALKCAWAGGKPRFDRALASLRRDDDLVESCIAKGASSRMENGRLAVAAPLEYDGDIVGALRIEASCSPEQVQLVVPRFAELARFIALAVKTPDLYTRAVEDGLTGLATKRYFQSRLEELVERARRSGEPLTLIMVDVDHFKKVNDSHGHLTGDTVLKGVAALLRKGVRVKAGDRAYNAYRYGGEEMSVLLPHTGAERAAEVAERLRLSIQMTRFVSEKKEPVPVTASFGVAQFDPATMATPEDLISRADEALYHAKETGRNKVVVIPASSAASRVA